MTAAACERLQIRVPILLISTGAWMLLLLEPNVMAVHALCSDGMPGMPPSASLKMLIANHRLASVAAGWAVMLAAMMSPLMMAPVRHVRHRSFARRRAGAIALFAAGYASIWMAAGVLLLALAISARQIAPIASVFLLIIGAVAVIWQFSPIKQRCLNRCHAHPELAAFGLAARLDAFFFGLKHGIWCVGSCWPLMLLPLALSRAHLVAMAAATLWLVTERLEAPVPPRWRWRAPSKAAHILRAQVQMILQRG